MQNSFKQNIYTSCFQVLESRIQQLQNDLRGLKEGTENDSKSSAGDKHETARAMMQIEYEKISRLLEEIQRQKNELEKIDIHSVSGIIKNGSIVKTNNGHFFLGAAVGKLDVDGVQVMTITLQSPIGQKLFGQKKDDFIDMNGLKYVIENIE